MTLVPIKGGRTDAALTTVSADTTPGPGASPPGDFLAAMQRALAPSQATTKDTPAPPASPATAEPDTGTVVPDPAAVGLLAVLPVPGLAASSQGGETGATVAAGRAAVADVTAVRSIGPTGDMLTSGSAAGAAGSAATAAASGNRAQSVASPGSAEVPAAPTIESATPGTATTTPDAAPGSIRSRAAASSNGQDGGADPNDPRSGAAVGSSPTAESPTVPTQAQPAAPGASASAASTVVPAVSSDGPGEVAPAQHVVRQVIPEVTSLVSRGDGTHRITLALKPEALGEVRVVMTVRDGSVHVRLAAGHEAQQALLQGSPELTRLLEQAGATDTRVVVRDLGSASTSPSVGPGAGGTGQQDQHAGTRAHHPATDGTHDGSTGHTRAASGTNPSRSDEPVTRTRTAGVDVTM